MYDKKGIVAECAYDYMLIAVDEFLQERYLRNQYESIGIYRVLEADDGINALKAVSGCLSGYCSS
jgi:hypothetical protein